MPNLRPVVISTRQTLVQIGSCVLLLACCAPLEGQGTLSTTLASSPAEQKALRVLNDSDWAHTVNPTEYLVRFQSAKPVQDAIQELLAMGEKWSAYGPARPVSDSDGPTDLPNARYNIADMITIAVILKHVGPDGSSLFNYAFDGDGRTFPSRTFRVWPCAGLRTIHGQVFAHVVPSAFGRRGYRAMQLSFPRLIDRKPLILNSREKVEFRMVVNQRVFEAIFYINPGDVLDGSEKSLYLPSAFTEVEEIVGQTKN